MRAKGQRPWFVKMGGAKIIDYKSVFIGEDCYFDTLAPECIVVENNVLLTKGCSILTHYYDVNNDSFTYGKEKVILKEHCFIGWNVTICKPVTIGRYAVVGAGSVVTKDIPDYEVWAGNPARFIKKRK
jgi:UDP-2-acetamido-3-amino-2,3-dideoxy-glucuronate N-acetyltransferase